MVYYEISIQASAPHAPEILMAELAAIGFESFIEEGAELKGYIRQTEWDEQRLAEIIEAYNKDFEILYSVKEIPAQNWNALWESNFQPIEIPERLRVRALFHEHDPSIPMEIIIQPKMSFGTGHHATTYQVMEMMLAISLKDKKVMDFGTGTGILAILACKLGASEVWAVDNDPQCVENSEENFSLNGCENIKLWQGDLDVAGSTAFDIIIGNITRNIILDFLPSISAHLHDGGYFIASGFYTPDLELLEPQAESAGLKLMKNTEKDNWCAALFAKK